MQSKRCDPHVYEVTTSLDKRLYFSFEIYHFFSEEYQRVAIWNPWIWLVNRALMTGPVLRRMHNGPDFYPGHSQRSKKELKVKPAENNKKVIDWSRFVRIWENCALDLHYGPRPFGLRPYLRPGAQFTPIWFCRPVNNIYISVQSLL